MPSICCDNVVNVAFFRGGKKRQYTKFHNSWLANFYYGKLLLVMIDPPLTSYFYLPLSIYHIKCEKFCQMFCVYKLSQKQVLRD